MAAIFRDRFIRIRVMPLRVRDGLGRICMFVSAAGRFLAIVRHRCYRCFARGSYTSTIL